MKFKHFMLKFNHGVEIGANLAYIGHYNRTNIDYVQIISFEETEHKLVLESILQELEEKPSWLIDTFFKIIGNIIFYLCAISPKFLLNKIAYLLEIFAIFSYHKLAKKYPKYAYHFNHMAKIEKEHKEYFKTGILPTKLKQSQNIKKLSI